MVYLDYFIKIASLITIMVTVGRFLYKFSKDMELVKNHVLENIDNVKDIKDIKEHCQENYMSILQLKIMCADMPMKERMISGDKYLANGGNGEIKKFIEKEFHPNFTEEDWQKHNEKKAN